jgi:hypothetical protein
MPNFFNLFAYAAPTLGISCIGVDNEIILLSYQSHKIKTIKKPARLQGGQTAQRR